jgi:hypothetical protein
VSTLVDPINWDVVDGWQLAPGAQDMVQWIGGGTNPVLDGIFLAPLPTLNAASRST